MHRVLLTKQKNNKRRSTTKYKLIKDKIKQNKKEEEKKTVLEEGKQNSCVYFYLKYSIYLTGNYEKIKNKS